MMKTLIKACITLLLQKDQNLKGKSLSRRKRKCLKKTDGKTIKVPDYIDLENLENHITLPGEGIKNEQTVYYFSNNSSINSSENSNGNPVLGNFNSEEGGDIKMIKEVSMPSIRS